MNRIREAEVPPSPLPAPQPTPVPRDGHGRRSRSQHLPVPTFAQSESCAPTSLLPTLSLRLPEPGTRNRDRGATGADARPLFLPLLLFVLVGQKRQHRIDAEESLVIRTGVRTFLSKAKAAGFLRLAFHDAGTFDMNDNTGGMNGSIVLELDRPENAGLSKSVKILEKAKNELDEVLQVSWADLIAMAGAEAVSFCGGPVIPIRLGRMDARVPDPEGKLPDEKLSASELKKCFLGKGFSWHVEDDRASIRPRTC